MPRNRKEKMIFALLMSTLMVLGMSIYNILLHTSINNITFSRLLAEMLPSLVVVLILSELFVNKTVRKFAFKLPINKEKKTQVIIAVSGCTIIQMVLLMSLFGTITYNGLSSDFLWIYAAAVLSNVLMAVPLQFLIARPVSRYILSKIQEKYDR
ncbi:MAG: DUF2798 domain-containing protein [Prevotellaceae bacterium]|jgi:hypothetical protein|nr:DUF2798 domain-containing protein [Prevotellaceae bacterium]